MNIHEYQGKEILLVTSSHSTRNRCNTAVEAVAAAKQLTPETGTSWCCKAKFMVDGKGGGVKLAKNLQAEEVAGKLSECN
jgi:succinyl-CoA synthetase beta subunit